jgi:hypothetical protein
LPSLADVEPLGIAPGQVEHRRRDQPVVDHDVGLLHQAQRLRRQQVRIARPTTDQVDLALGECVLRRIQGLLHHLVRGRLLAGQYALGDRPLQHLLPEILALATGGEARLDLLAEALDEIPQASVGGRDQLLQTHADQPRQHRRGTAGRHGGDHRRAVDDRRHDEAAQRRVVGDVDRHVEYARGIGDLGVDPTVVGGREGDPATGQVAVVVTPLVVGHLAFGDASRQRLAEPRRDHGDVAAGAQQQRSLALRDLAATDHQAALAAQVEKDRKEFHGFGGDPAA